MAGTISEAAMPSPKKPSKVSHKTINEMRTMGMSKAIERANSGQAGDEFVEGARRMYGNRIHSRIGKPSQNVQKPVKAAPKVEGGDTVAKHPNQKVYKEPKAKKKTTWDRSFGRFL